MESNDAVIKTKNDRAARPSHCNCSERGKAISESTTVAVSDRIVTCFTTCYSGAVATLAEVFMSQAKIQLASVRALNIQMRADAAETEPSDRAHISPSGDLPGTLGGNEEIAGSHGELATASKLSNVMIPVLL